MANIGNIGGQFGQVPQKRVDNQQDQGQSVRKTDTASQGGTDGLSSFGDQAEIGSDNSALLAKATEAFYNTSDVREDVIARVQERIKSGYYDNPAIVEALAGGLAQGFSEA